MKWSGQAGVQTCWRTFFTESYFVILLDLTFLIYLVICAVDQQSVSSYFFRILSVFSAYFNLDAMTDDIEMSLSLSFQMGRFGSRFDAVDDVLLETASLSLALPRSPSHMCSSLI
jgi:hypothetical protein